MDDLIDAVINGEDDDIDEDDLIDDLIDTEHLIGVDPAPASALESAVHRDKLAALFMRGMTKYLDRGMTSAKINAATDAEIEAMFTRYKMKITRAILIRYTQKCDRVLKRKRVALPHCKDRDMTVHGRRAYSYTCTDSKQ